MYPNYALINVNPLMGTNNYSATSNNMKLVHWPVAGGLLHLVRWGWELAGPPRPLLAVPNVTAHPSTASVPITVLLCGPLLCGLYLPIEGLKRWYKLQQWVDRPLWLPCRDPAPRIAFQDKRAVRGWMEVTDRRCHWAKCYTTEHDRHAASALGGTPEVVENTPPSDSSLPC